MPVLNTSYMYLLAYLFTYSHRASLSATVTVCLSGKKQLGWSYNPSTMAYKYNIV